VATMTVSTQNLPGAATALGWADTFTVVIDRPVAGGGGGKGFNGGQLLYLAIAACVSNDLFREAAARDIELDRVAVDVSGSFDGEPAVSGEVVYRVTVSGAAPREELEALVTIVDTIAEIPNSLRAGTSVRLGDVTVEPTW
jgi:putative redox protein